MNNLAIEITLTISLHTQHFNLETVHLHLLRVANILEGQKFANVLTLVSLKLDNRSGLIGNYSSVTIVGFLNVLENLVHIEVDS